VAKKKVTAAAALVSSKEALPTVGLSLQLEVPTVVASNPGSKVGGGSVELWPECPDGGGGGQYPPGGGGGHNIVCPDCGRPSPRHHGCWTHMRTL
jgi:hypothetical protein